MRPEYNGIKFYSANDYSIGSFFRKAQPVLEAFSTDKEINNINEIIELYNIYQIINSGGIKEVYAAPYYDTVRKFMKPIALFFQSITDSCLLEQYLKVCLTYVDDFWTLFEKFKVYNIISPDCFAELLNHPDTSLHLILGHKDVVSQYDSLIADHMRKSSQSAEIIIGYFLERKSGNTKTIFLPKTLLPKEYESILNQYIYSESPNVGLLQLLASSQSSGECPLSDSLRLKAKHRAEELWKNRAGKGIALTYGVGICFKSNPDIITINAQNPREFSFIYDIDWIRDNTDFPTLLNNFIHLFGFVDGCFRCVFPSNPSKMTVLEKELGVKGIKQYDTGIVFNFYEMKSLSEIHGYSDVLLALNIQLEEIIQWFFSDYLNIEFNTNGFLINMPSKDNSILQKCRDLPSEMDGILKQFKLFVENGSIDRELFEMSSNPCIFSEIPSMLSNKYAYAKSDEIKREQSLLFSDQNLLGYLPRTSQTYHTFWELLNTQEIAITAYDDIEQQLIRWLESRSTVVVDSTGIIHLNKKRTFVLKDLYEHEVICPLHYHDKSVVEKMISNGDLYYADTLFSYPEQQYLNYMLNKSEFSNGKDLRNKYIHSTYPKDEEQQLTDYYSLLKIMIVVVIKINEEFCLKYPQTIEE